MLIHYLYTITIYLKLIKQSYLKLYLIELKICSKDYKLTKFPLAKLDFKYYFLLFNKMCFITICLAHIYIT